MSMPIDFLRACAVAVVALVLIAAAAYRASRVWDRHQRAPADPRAYLRRRMDRIRRWEVRCRFAAIAALEWPDGIKPAPSQPSTSDEHFRRIAEEVVPDNATDWENPK